MADDKGQPTPPVDAHEKLAALLNVFRRMQAQQAQARAQARAQAQPIALTPAVVPSVGQPQLPFGVGGGGGGALPPTLFQPTPRTPAIEPGLMSTGFSFPNRAARNAAVVSGAIQNVGQALERFKRGQQDKISKQAEQYMTQILNAQDIMTQYAQDPSNPVYQQAQQVYSMLTQDKKVAKILQKGLDVPRMPEMGPEAKGVISAAKKFKQQKDGLPTANTPGGLVIPGGQSPQQQLANLIAAYKIRAAQQNPTALRQLATGTTLTPEEQHEAELVKTGQEPSAEAKLSAKTALEAARISAGAKGFRQVSKEGDVVSFGGIGDDGKQHIYSVEYDNKGKPHAPSDAPLEVQRAILDAVKGQQHAWDAQAKLTAQRDADSLKRTLVQVDVRDRTQVNKVLAPLVDASANVAESQKLLGRVIGGNDQQAGLALAAMDLGVQQSFAGGKLRMSKAFYDEAVKSRDWLAAVKAHFDSKDPDEVYLSNIVLTPKQARQMVQNISERVDVERAKAKTTIDLMNKLGANIPSGTLPILQGVAPAQQAPSQQAPSQGAPSDLFGDKPN